MDGSVLRARQRVVVLAMAALGWAVAASAQVGYMGSLYFVRAETAEGERTDAVYLFTSLEVERGRLRGSVTIPVIAQQSRWTDAELGPVETGWQSGLSDPIVRLDAQVWRTPLRDTSVRLSGAVKVPVASVGDGFSSGKPDVAIGASVSRFRGRNSVLADLTYWILGDPSEIDYRNVPAFYIGYGRVLDGRSRWSGIVSVSGASSATEGFAGPVQLSVAMLRVLSAAAAFGVSVDVGLTDGAADFAVGTTWRVGFQPRSREP
jgi:hypothetical protein